MSLAPEGTRIDRREVRDSIAFGKCKFGLRSFLPPLHSQRGYDGLRTNKLTITPNSLVIGAEALRPSLPSFFISDGPKCAAHSARRRDRCGSTTAIWILTARRAGAP